MAAKPTWRRIALICGGAALLAPVVAVIGSPVVPVLLRLILIGLWLTAVASPHRALLGLAILAPFGSLLLAAFDAPPVQYTEALIVTALSGLVVAAGLERGANAPRFSPSIRRPALLFGGIVVCSVAVGLAVSQAGLGVRWPFVRNVLTFLVRDYLLGPSDQAVSIAAAVLLLEGVLLLCVVAGFTCQAADRSKQIVTALAAAAAVAAVISIVQVVLTMRGLHSLRDVWATLATSRIGAHVKDANAAGSFFAMSGFVVLALSLGPGTPRSLRRLWIVAAVALSVALGLTGSRTAIGSIVVVLALAGGWSAWRGLRQIPSWLIAAAAVACVLGAVAVGFDPRAVARRSLIQTLDERAAFVITGLRIMATAPVFGVGVGRYLEMSGDFMPQSIYWFHLRENAHNNFLQIGGELGLAGLAAFLWLLAAAGLRIARGWRAHPGDSLIAGAFAGLAAFVITWMAGHPMLTPEVAFPFWMLLGAVIARADGYRTTSSVPAVSGERVVGTVGRAAPYATGLALLLVIATVPVRAGREISATSLGQRSFGFYGWEPDRAIGRLRWTSASAAFFIPVDTSELDLPINAAYAERRPTPTILTIAIDGQVFHRIDLTSSGWKTLRLRVPPPTVRSGQYRRVDIVIDPSWSPAAVLGLHDSRVLGIQVGDVITR